MRAVNEGREINWCMLEFGSIYGSFNSCDTNNNNNNNNNDYYYYYYYYYSSLKPFCVSL